MMLKLNQKHSAALEAVVHIACLSGGEPVSGKVLAEAIGQPPRYLEPMLQQLVRAGILRGIRGPKGGYVLAKERRRVSVKVICEALTEEDELRPPRISALGNEVVKPLCKSALNAAHELLDTIDLAQLCEQAKQARRETAAANKPDFTI